MKVFLVMNGEDKVTRVFATREGASRWIAEKTQPGWCHISTFEVEDPPRMTFRGVCAWLASLLDPDEVYDPGEFAWEIENELLALRPKPLDSD